MKPLDRFTLAAITTVAVLAAFLTATWIPTHYTPGPLLTWACVYTATTLTLARATRLPPARTLYAATLLTATALRILLTGLARALDHATTAGTALLTDQKASTR